MVQDTGMGLPRRAIEADFTTEELDNLPRLVLGMHIKWRGVDWEVLRVDPLLIEEVLDDGS